jgi:hypothetical protein
MGGVYLSLGPVSRGSQRNQTFGEQLLGHTLVRTLEFVDHARVAQHLKQGDGLFVGQFAVLERDDVLGEQVHVRSIPGTPARVKRVEQKKILGKGG